LAASITRIPEINIVKIKKIATPENMHKICDNPFVGLMYSQGIDETPILKQRIAIAVYIKRNLDCAFSVITLYFAMVLFFDFGCFDFNPERKDDYYHNPQSRCNNPMFGA
jgi:hypothetical protein